MNIWTLLLVLPFVAMIAMQFGGGRAGHRGGDVRGGGCCGGGADGHSDTNSAPPLDEPHRRRGERDRQIQEREATQQSPIGGDPQ